MVENSFARRNAAFPPVGFNGQGLLSRVHFPYSLEAGVGALPIFEPELFSILQSVFLVNRAYQIVQWASSADVWSCHGQIVCKTHFACHFCICWQNLRILILLATKNLPWVDVSSQHEGEKLLAHVQHVRFGPQAW